jgi:hypothetical protein
MQCVDKHLNPARTPSDWESLQSASFICVGCKLPVPAQSEQLFYFPDMDYFFHKHDDAFYYRALRLTNANEVKLSSGDSENENVIQAFSIYLDGVGGHGLRFKSLTEMREAAGTFFQAVREQNRSIKKSTFHMGHDGTFHFE